MSDFRFYSPQYLWLLLLLPIYFWIYKWHWKKLQRQLAKFFPSDKLKFLLRGLDLQKARRIVVLQMCGLFFLIIALARPQSSDGTIKIKNEGSEIILAVDVSRSMLAQDLKPSRLAIAKKELMRLVDLSHGDRFGLIAFAGSAVLLSPITADRDAIKMYIESLSTDTISTQGTDFTKAFDLVQRSFLKGSVATPDLQDTVVSQSVLVASDGENHQEGALERAKELARQNVKIFTVAFGTEEGAPLPVTDRAGNMRGYLTDRSGQTVLSKVDGEALKEIASASDGDFYPFSFQGNTMEKISATLDQLEKSKFDEGEIKTYGELFQYFLPIALFFFVLSLSTSRAKRKFGLWKGRFEANA